MKRRYFLIVTVILFLVCLSFSMMACSYSQGIPDGSYIQCDEFGNFYPEDGTVFSSGPEDHWVLYNNTAKYLYSEFNVVEIDNKIYFEYSSIIYSGESLEPATICTQYKVEYDKSTKILTVYMPSEGNADDETAFYFRKVTLKERIS